MHTKRILTGITSLLALGTLSLTGCNTNTAATTNSPTPPNSASNTSQAPIQNKKLLNATVSLKAQNGSKVQGVGTMTLVPKSHELTVVVEASGLKPGEKYGAKIEDSKTHKVSYTFKTFTANSKGTGLLSSVVKNVTSVPSNDQLDILQTGTANTSTVASGFITTQNA